MNLAAIRHNLTAVRGWLQLGSLEDALAELDRLLPPADVHPQVLAVRVHLLLSVGRIAEAAAIISGLVQRLPEMAHIQGLAARTAALQGRREDARAHLRIALQLTPDRGEKLRLFGELEAIWPRETGWTARPGYPAKPSPDREPA